jgi:hypothetical protein
MQGWGLKPWDIYHAHLFSLHVHPFCISEGGIEAYCFPELAHHEVGHVSLVNRIVFHERVSNVT